MADVDDATVAYKRKPFFAYEDRKTIVEALSTVSGVLHI